MLINLLKQPGRDMLPPCAARLGHPNAFTKSAKNARTSVESIKNNLSHKLKLISLWNVCTYYDFSFLFSCAL